MMDTHHIVDELTTRLDSLSEMGEMELLRLQMAMDRRSTMVTTLSNIMTEASETVGSVREPQVAAAVRRRCRVS